MTSPTDTGIFRQNFGIGPLLDQMRPYLLEMAAEAVRSALGAVRVPSLVPGTVTAIDMTSGKATVLPDGQNSSSLTVPSLVGMPLVGQRVMLLFQPPSGVFIAGVIDDRRTLLTGVTPVVYVATNRVSGTINYGATFSSVPEVVATVETGSFFDIMVNWTNTPGLSSVAYTTVTRAGGNVSGTAYIHWFAYGNLA